MFTKFLFSILLCLATALALADESVNLRIVVSGVTPGQGQVFVSLYNDEKTWLKEPLLVLRQSVGDSDSADVLFSGLQTGSYAASVFYDQDNDGELDTGIFRIPKEPVGFSNNARGKFGPAKWKQTNFLLEQDMDMTIRVMDAIE